MATILIADDEVHLRLTMKTALKRRGHQVIEADTFQAALAAFDRDVFDLALLDLRLPDGDGLDLLRQMRERSRDVAALMLTAFGTVENAVEAMRLGADDFLQKPFGPERLVASVERALAHRRVQGQLERLTEHERTAALVGDSQAMQDVRRSIEQSKGARVVLITGETGTGKDLVARAVHAVRAKAQSPLVVVNCAAFPERLIESELFGHVRGAYSDASGARRGLLVQADGGTVFLDEVAEVPLALQPRMLRFVENGEVRAVGADHTASVECAIVVATNQNLEELVERGEFREDLFYRLDVFRISLPPLRERPEDIPVLAQHFLPLIAQSSKQPVPKIDQAALEAAQAYDWPGNVRQFRHALERAVLLSRDDRITAAELVPSRRSASNALPAPEMDEPVLPMSEVERRHVLSVMERVEGDRAQAAELLGISRSTLRRKLIQYGVTG